MSEIEDASIPIRDPVDFMRRPRILSIDGPGIRGLGSLLILKRLMKRVADALNLDAPALPCECFDLIGGVGMGGLIAIMLGRLGMVTR
jgi:patatin-like phospholipase/acyl hydrolase